MTAATRRVARLIFVCLVALLAWFLIDLARFSHAHQIVAAGTPAETLVVQPGRSVILLYTFLVLVTLLLALAVAALVWLPGDDVGPPMGRAAKVFYGSLVFLGLAVSGAIAGFAYESLRTELRLSHTEIAYRAGDDHVTIPLRDVRWMVLHWRPRTQSIEVAGPHEVAHMDLSPFAAPDQILLLKLLPAYAGLGDGVRRAQDEIVWRRALRLESQ